MIIGITGLFGSGKDTVAHILAKKGFEHHSLSDEIRLELTNENIEASRENLQKRAIEIREKYSNNELAKRSLGRCKGKKCALTSIRTIGEVKFLKKNPNFVLWEIWAEPQARYKRLLERKDIKEVNTNSFKKFAQQESKELHGSGAQQNLMGVIKMADIKIKNNQSIKTLEGRINEALKNLPQD